MTVATKSAKYEKTTIHEVKGWIKIIPDETAGRFQCETFGPEYDMCASGWLAGHFNILGKFIQEQSIYTKLYCELMLTDVITSYSIHYTKLYEMAMFRLSHSQSPTGISHPSGSVRPHYPALLRQFRRTSTHHRRFPAISCRQHDLKSSGKDEFYTAIELRFTIDLR